MSNIKSISGRLPRDNSTWSLQDMLQHAAIEHSDEEVEHALLILSLKGGRGQFYAVRASRADMLWMIKRFEFFLLNGEDEL